MLLLAASLAVQSAYVNPGVAVAEVRAMACCAHRCDEPLSLPNARGCCQVTAVASGPAERPVSPGIGHAVTSASLAPVALPVPVARTSAPVPLARDHGTGPPTYLAQRHLLI
jgi:hypothetical protein